MSGSRGAMNVGRLNKEISPSVLLGQGASSIH